MAKEPRIKSLASYELKRARKSPITLELTRVWATDGSLNLTIPYTTSKNGDAIPSKEPADFETAVSLAGHGKFQYMLLVTCGLCMTCLILQSACIAYLLPAAQCELQLSSQSKGLLNAIAFVGMITSAHMWGFLADTVGRRKVLAFSLFADFICGVISSCSQTFWQLLLFRFFNGFFISGPSSVNFAYLGEFHSEKTRARAVVWLGVFVAAGVCSLPGLAWLIIPQPWSFENEYFKYNSWRIFVAVCSVPSLVTAILLTWFPESPKYLMSSGRPEEALDVFRKMFKLNTGQDPDDYPVMKVQTESDGFKLKTGSFMKAVESVLTMLWGQTKPLLTRPYLSVTFLTCFMQFGTMFGYNGMLLWLPELFNRMQDFYGFYPNESLSVCEIIEFGPPGLAVIQSDLDVVNTSVLTMDDGQRLLYHSDSGNVSDSSLQILYTADVNSSVVLEGCSDFVNEQVFINTLIIGATGGMINLIAGLTVSKIGKKNLIILSSFIAAGCGYGIYFTRTTLQNLSLTAVYVALSGMCIGVIGSIVIDLFPTHLRAMAVSVVMMSGRLGVIVGNILFGILLEIKCAIPFFLVTSVIAGCGVLCFFIPKSIGKPAK